MKMLFAFIIIFPGAHMEVPMTTNAVNTFGLYESLEGCLEQARITEVRLNERGVFYQTRVDCIPVPVGQHGSLLSMN